MCVILDGSSKQHETDVQFKGGSDITKGGDISVIDFPTGFRRACGPPARVQGSLVYRDGEPLAESDRRYAFFPLYLLMFNQYVVLQINTIFINKYFKSNKSLM